MLGSKSIFSVMLFLCCFGSPPRRPKRRPRGSKTPPRAPQEAPRGRQARPRRPKEEPKRPQEPVKRAKDLSRSPLKAAKHTKDLEKHNPQDNCGYQCCRYRRDRYKSKTLHPRRSSEWSGGRRCSPLGEAIRRPPRTGRSTACQTPRRNCRSGQKSQDLSNRSLHLTAKLLWRSFLTPL